MSNYTEILKKRNTSMPNFNCWNENGIETAMKVRTANIYVTAFSGFTSQPGYFIQQDCIGKYQEATENHALR